MSDEVPEWDQLRARINAPGFQTAAGVMRWESDREDFRGNQPPSGTCSFRWAADERWRVEDEQGLLHIDDGERAFVRGDDGVMVRADALPADVPDGHPWSLFGSPLDRHDLFTTETDFFYPLGPAGRAVVAGRRGWEVALRPPPHKEHPLVVVVDDLTGVLLRMVAGGGGWLVELSKFTPHVEIDPGVFHWSGPWAEPQPPPPSSGSSRISGVIPEGTPMTAEILDQLRERLSVIETMLLASDRRREVAEAVASADDTLSARASVAELLGTSTDAAHWVLDLQLRRFSRLEQARLREERDELRQRLDRSETKDCGPG